MTVDAYAVCPCGSGKKIKFCKCKDSVGELDRVLKMVEGGQIVPALDRLAKVLNEHPDAAWALAVRGRLLLDVREYQSLAENADRFIRLQPSNPLALTQRAAAELFRGSLREANESLLEALTESGRDVDAFVLDVASVLAFSLAQAGQYLSARVYATLAMMAQGYEGGQTAMQVLRQLNSSAMVNQLLKGIPEPLPRPDHADWSERFDEATRLLQSNKVLLAQSKFESLRRTVPQEPAILTGLLTCAIWRGDAAAQSELMLKLSGCESLAFEERARYRAMAALTEPEMPQIAVPVLKLTADIDQVEQVEMALAADARCIPLPAEMLQNLEPNEDEVPPRGGFQILDRDKPDDQQLPPVDQVPESLAVVFVFGRQTDRAARMEVIDVRRRDLDEVVSRLKGMLGDIELTETTGDPLPLLVASQPPVAMIRFQAKPIEAEKLQAALAEQRSPKSIAELPLGILGGASLIETAGDDSKLLERTAVVRIIESYDAIVQRGSAIMSKIYELANIEPLPPLKLSDEEVETVNNVDLNRIDPADLDGESVIYLLQRAQQISASPAIRQLASRLLEMELPAEQVSAKLLGYLSLVNAASNVEAALEVLEKAKQFAEQNNLPTSDLLLSEVSLRLSAGDMAGFQGAIETLTSRYGREPETMARLQQMLISFGLIRPDGSPRSAPPGPAPGGDGGGGGIWTPGSASPAAAEPAPGGSKLWIPGMD